MKIREERNKEAFNTDCASAGGFLKVWDVSLLTKDVSSGKKFSEKVQHYLLTNPEKSYSMNSIEMKKLAKVFRKYHKLFRKERR